MKYQSTRGGTTGLSFQDAIMGGYAPDGGMYMPEEIPKLSEETLQSWSKLPYTGIVKEIAKLYIGDEIPDAKIEELIDAAFETFQDPACPIVTKQLKGDILLMEMFYGKSLAFKDLSMCCVAQFMQYFLELSKDRIIILIATSGDTGSAALEGMSSVQNVDTVVAYPKGRISEVQELQMTTVVSDNCYAIRADGTSDDIDAKMMKEIFMDKEYVAKYRLGSINSVNWCRSMVQIAHHFYSYFQGKAVDSEKETVIFIPTGGLGNATAACLARVMGLPIRIVCAVTNDALYRAIHDNDYSMGELNVSLATAMNIQTPYNWERVLYAFSGKDTAMVKSRLYEYEVEGKTTTPEDILIKLRAFMEVKVVSDEDIIATMKQCYSENNQYVICPHTATALTAANSYANGEAYNKVVFGVASPAKFSEAVTKAGIDWKGRNLMEELKNKPSRCTDYTASEDWLSKLKELVEGIDLKNRKAEL